jgi:hypothetical protein
LIEIEEIFLHPEYNDGNMDFALLRLKNGTVFPNEVKFALLPSIDDAKTGEMMRIAGWGRTETTIPTQYLLGAEVPIYDTEKCKGAYGSLTSAMICAGYEDGKIDTCQGN